MDKSLVAASGLHYVCYQLCLRGYAIGVTAPGVESVDVLAANTKNGKSISLQVKTMRTAVRTSKKDGTSWCWRVGKLADMEFRDNLFFALVELGESDKPEVFILPSANLASHVERYARNDNWCCLYENKDTGEYRNAWNRLEQYLGPA